jgi:hypothetical protein
MEFERDPDAAWVATLAGAGRADCERALARAAAETRLFDHIAREHRSEGRTSYIEIDAPFELYAITRLTRPQHVVEVGVSSGVSSAYLLQALERNRKGALHSVDLPKRPPSHASRPPRASWSLPEGREPGWAIPPALRGRWDLRLGDKRKLVPALAQELDRVDLFVYDVPHDDDRSMTEFLEVDRKLPVGGVAIVDHGPGGGRCPLLHRWARRRGAEAPGRAGLGLYGFRARSRGV